MGAARGRETFSATENGVQIRSALHAHTPSCKERAQLCRHRGVTRVLSHDKLHDVARALARVAQSSPVGAERDELASSSEISALRRDVQRRPPEDERALISAPRSHSSRNTAAWPPIAAYINGV